MQSHYEKLPVYREALRLAAYFENIVRGFEKFHKYNIGSDLRNLSRSILVNIAEANIRQQRKESLEAAIKELRRLKIIIHLAVELKAFRSVNNIEEATRLTVTVLRQCEGWYKARIS